MCPYVTCIQAFWDIDQKFQAKKHLSLQKTINISHVKTQAIGKVCDKYSQSLGYGYGEREKMATTDD